MPDAVGQVDAALQRLLREDHGRLMAALIGQLRDFQLAEDCLQDAYTSAMVHWHRSGVPRAPAGWILTAARRKAIDRIRRDGRWRARQPDLAILAAADEADASDSAPDIPDDRLRLIFTCCHPALAPKSRVALTLRTLGGLTTAQIASTFLDSEATMGQRLSRAKAKIAAAGIAFKIPEAEDWADRLNSVLTVIYLIFNAGYTAGPDAGRDLCDEAVFLARMLNSLTPAQPEVEGCLALLLLTHARHAARIGPTGETVPLVKHDNSLWDRAMIADGQAVLDQALTRHAPGPFQIKAAISSLHSENEGPNCKAPDWPQIAALYGALMQWEPSPVVRLNHAAAVAEGQGATVGLALLDGLVADLHSYQPFHAARAEYLARTGCHAEASAAYDRAISLASSSADKAYLARRKADLPEKPEG